MSSNVKRDHHNLRRNLKLNGKYISNDGGDEGITVNNTGGVTLSAGGAVTGGLSVDYNLSDDASHISGFQALLVDADITGAFSQTNIVTGIGNSINLTEAVGGGTFLFGITNTTTVAHAADSGSIVTVGLTNNVIVSNANATSSATGISNIVTGGDVNIGFDQKVADGNIDIKLKSSADIADYFSISTGASGATIIATVDSDATAAHLTLSPDGEIILDAQNADGNSNHGIQLKVNAAGAGEDTQLFGVLTQHHAVSHFTLYEGGGTSTNDYFNIAVAAEGVTTISTVDANAAVAHLTLDPDGDIILDAATGNIILKNDGGNYTPGSDYEAATKKYVDDNAGGITTGKSIAMAMIFG